MRAYATAIRVGAIESDTGSAWLDVVVVFCLIAFGAWVYVRVRRSLHGTDANGSER